MATVLEELLGDVEGLGLGLGLGFGLGLERKESELESTSSPEMSAVLEVGLVVVSSVSELELVGSDSEVLVVDADAAKTG